MGWQEVSNSFFESHQEFSSLNWPRTIETGIGLAEFVATDAEVWWTRFTSAHALYNRALPTNVFILDIQVGKQRSFYGGNFPAARQFADGWFDSSLSVYFPVLAVGFIRAIFMSECERIAEEFSLQLSALSSTIETTKAAIKCNAREAAYLLEKRAKATGLVSAESTYELSSNRHLVEPESGVSIMGTVFSRAFSTPSPKRERTLSDDTCDVGELSDCDIESNAKRGRTTSGLATFIGERGNQL
ncbi:hypothetical protein HK096_010955 [Nowakowskiella sp. JEL0078]|nr:hypothetical protein HK096_010955 [Nowakowskiella sp. JEL0078]